MLAGKQAADISACYKSQTAMINNFAPAPLSTDDIADVAAYIASSKFPN